MQKYHKYNVEWRIKNKDKVRENDKKWRLANPDKVKESKHRDYLKNKERYNRQSLESSNRRKKANPELFAQQQRAKMNKYHKTPKGIYKVLVKRTKDKKYKTIIGQDEFINWYKSEEKKCYYCGIPEERLNLVKNFRGKLRFSIDRKDNNNGYTRENICLACLTCNRVKGEIFSPEIMKKIANKFIKPIWKNQMK